jgi:NADPH:quinone reductase and related Zn-dependent oxidoreductases
MGPAVLDQLAKFLEDGSLQPVVDKIFTPQDAELAFQHADSSEAIGKTIIRFR